MKFGKSSYIVGLLALVGGTVTVRAAADGGIFDTIQRHIYNSSVAYTRAVAFPQRLGAPGDVDSGRANFGLSADETAIDTTAGFFEGDSQVGGHIVSNGRVCATCHRPDNGSPNHLGMPQTPVSSTVPLSDPLFTQIDTDAGGNPDAMTNLDQHGLLVYRPSRFNPLISEDDPRSKVFFWRKAQRFENTVFTFGFLNDGRARDIVEAARGAVFSHTQSGDLRFDDLVDIQRLRDVSAFIESKIDPPELAALLDPNDPEYPILVNDPFATVHPSSALERAGEAVFQQKCMTCHNTPNVFSNIDHRNNNPLVTPPGYGHTYDIGVAERNAFHLDFRVFDPVTNTRTTLVLPLVKQTGSVVNLPIVDDIGLAGTTTRYEDLHKFKVPQLRKVRELGPYFHDGSASTLEDVVNYFNGRDYNSSPDGRLHPIHMNGRERSALLAFLKIL